MAAQIGPLTLKIGANADGLTQTLGKVMRDTDSFAARAAKSVSAVAASLDPSKGMAAGMQAAQAAADAMRAKMNGKPLVASRAAMPVDPKALEETRRAMQAALNVMRLQVGERPISLPMTVARMDTSEIAAAKAALASLRGMLGNKRMRLSLGIEGVEAAKAQIGEIQAKLNSLRPPSVGKSLMKGLAAAKDAIGRITAQTLMGGAASIASGMQKAIGDPGKFLAENVIGGLARIVGEIPMVGPALAIPLGLVGGAMSAVFDQFDVGSKRITALAMASMRTGVSMTDLRAVMIAAGPASESVEKAFYRLQVTMGKAAVGNSEAIAKFEQLGFVGRDNKDVIRRLGEAAAAAGKPIAGIGITVEQLVKMPAAQQLGLIADRISGLESPALKAKAAFDLMSRQGLALLPMLNQGSAGIKRGQALAEQFGMGSSPNDLANIRAANEGKKTIQLAGEGMTNQITLGVAPILAELGNLGKMFSATGFTMKSVAGYIVDAFEIVATVGAYVVETWNGLVFTFQAIKIGVSAVPILFLKLAGVVMETFSLIVRKIASVALAMVNILPAKVLKKVGLDVEAIRNEINKTFDGSTGKGMKDTANDFLSESRKEAKDLWKNFTPGGAVGKVNDFFGAVRKRMAETKSAAAELNPFEAWMKFGPRAQEIKKELDGPLGVFREKFREIQQISKAGVFGLFKDDVGSMAIGKQMQDLNNSFQLPEKKFTGAALNDSTEAYSAIIQHKFGDQNDTVQERIEKILQEQTARQDDLIRIGQETRDAVRKNPALGVI